MRLILKIYSFSQYTKKQEDGDKTEIRCYFASGNLDDRYNKCIAMYGIDDAIILVQWLKMQSLTQINNFSKISFL